MTGVLLSWS